MNLINMTNHQRLILLRLQTGRSYKEIAKALGMQLQSLYNTVWRMKEKGINIAKEIKPPRQPRKLTPTQRTVLYFYMTHTPVEEIARKLQISCGTVMNHASEGFKRLGLTTPGVDRIAALRGILEQSSGTHSASTEPQRISPSGKITMEDTFFN